MDPITYLAVVSIGNAVGISVGAMEHGPGAWLRRRLAFWAWLNRLLACAVCTSFWAGSAAGGAVYAVTGEMPYLAAGCVAMTLQYAIAAVGKRS